MSSTSKCTTDYHFGPLEPKKNSLHDCLVFVGLPPTPARGFHPEPHDAHASFVLRLRRLKEHVLNRHKATLSREDKKKPKNTPSDTQRQTNKPKQFLSWLQSYFQAPTKSEHKQCVSIVGSGVEQTPGGVSENGSDKPAFKDVFVLWGEFVC